MRYRNLRLVLLLLAVQLLAVGQVRAQFELSSPGSILSGWVDQPGLVVEPPVATHGPGYAAACGACPTVGACPSGSDCEGNLFADGRFGLGYFRGTGNSVQSAYPGWFARGEAIFYHRSRTRDRLLSVADNNSPDFLADDIPLFTARDLRFNDFETGYRLALGRSLPNGLSLEGEFFTINEWDAQDQITSSGQFMVGPVGDALSPPFKQPNPALLDLRNFYQALQHSFDYRSELTSAEMNLRATWSWKNLVRSELLGFRYVQLREDLMFISLDDRLATPQLGTGVYKNRTDNDLFGFQYGQDLTVPLNNAIHLTGAIKAGAFLNSSEQETQISNNNVRVVDAEGETDEIAFVGEINFRALWRLNHLVSVRGGYDFIWIDGVALAPEQYTFNPGEFTNLNRNGNIFYHGFSLGIELRR